VAHAKEPPGAERRLGRIVQLLLVDIDRKIVKRSGRLGCSPIVREESRWRRSSSRASGQATTSGGVRCSTRTSHAPEKRGLVQRVLRSTDDPNEVFIYLEYKPGYERDG